jgi:hypothetical protein
MELKWVWIFTLVGIVFLAGCIQLPGGTQTTRGGVSSGVVIKSFYAVNPEIYSGDDAYFDFTVENIGESDANNVCVKIYGLSDMEWTNWQPSNKMTCPGLLNKANPTEKLPGGIATGEFSVKSPQGLKVDTTYTALIRVMYSYSTSGEGKIKLYNKTYLNAMPIEEAKKIRSSSGIESFVTTKGAPVQLSLTGLPRPLEDGGSSRKITLVIENVGQGGNYLTTPDDRKVRIKTFKVGNTDCTSVAGFEREPALPRTGSKMITCEFTVPPVSEFTTIPVKVEIEYNYFVDTSTTIKVLKSPV